MNHSGEVPPPTRAEDRITRSPPSPPIPARRSHRARTRAGSRSPWTDPSWSGSSTKSFSVPCPFRKGEGSAIQALRVALRPVVVVELVDGHPVRLHLTGDHGAARHARL